MINKNFWEKLDRLEWLAKRASEGNWFITDDDYSGKVITSDNYSEKVIDSVIKDQFEIRIASFEDAVDAERNAEYIAAANPAMIREMIGALRELFENNYGPDMLNDPQALTISYFAGCMAEGRKRNIKEDKLLEEKAQLEREADWLADMLSDICHDYEAGCAICPRTKRPCWEIMANDWREAARKAVKENREDDNA